jgi:hypothetical protein
MSGAPRIGSFAFAFAFAFAWSGRVSAHGTSKSFAEWNIDGATAKLRVNFASHDAFAAVIGLDADGDMKLSAAELEAGRVAFGARTIAATELSIGPAGKRSACVAGEPTVRGIGEPVEEIQVEATFTCPAIVRELHLVTRYLPELDPPHLGVSTVIAREVTAQHVFAPTTPEFDLVLAPPSFGERLSQSLAAGLEVGVQPHPLILGLGIGVLATTVDGLLAVLFFLIASTIAAVIFEGAAPWALYPALVFGLGASGLVAADKKLPRVVPLVLGTICGFALGSGAGAGLAAGVSAAGPGAILGAIGAVCVPWLRGRKRGLGYGLAAAALLLLANKVLG